MNRWAVALAFVLAAPSAAAAPTRQSSAPAPPPAEPAREFETVRRLAFQYVGRPYAMGGMGRPAFDCSGFVRRVFAEAGYRLPRVSRNQARVGQPVDLDALAPGDLVFFADPKPRISHVGLYLGDGELIHASSTQGEVTVSSLSDGWYQDHLVAARRILGQGPDLRLSGEEGAEHEGEFALAPMLRRPPRRPEPNYGPQLTLATRTAVSSRAALLTEVERPAFTLVPELSFVYRAWALELTLGVVVRFPFDGPVTVGRFESVRDYLRFIRTVRLGLPGADLELVLSRLGDLTLGSGALVDHVTPGTTVRGVPGLTVAPSPMATTVGLRGDDAFFRGVLDDAFDPAFFGLEGGVTPRPFTLGVAAAIDVQARFRDRRKAVSGVEAYLRVDLVDSAAWSLDVSGQGAVMALASDFGASAEAVLRLQNRFGEAETISIDVHGGYLGPGALRAVFGPTYLARRSLHTEALAESKGRSSIGAELRLDVGKWRAAIAYGDAIGAGSHPFDRSVLAMLIVQGLSLGATRLLDFRAIYVARAFGRGQGVADVAQVGLQLRFSPWLSAETHFQLGTHGNGGAGVMVQWAL